jgi:hypothetical protein
LELILKDKRVIRFSTASIEDVDAIINLYIEVYKGKYTLPEVADPEIVAQKVEDPGYFWTVAKIDNRLIGSVIFAIDPVNKLGKSYAAVVLGEFRGQDVMRVMVKHSLEKLTEKTRTCDAIYATTRTVSFAPQMVLEHLNFKSTGIFPNVRKVESFETHGLEVYFGPKCLEFRRKTPKLIPQMLDFYKIVQSDLNLEDPEIIELESKDPRKMGRPICFDVCSDIKAVTDKFYEYQNKDMMQRVFFPFTDPNMLYSAKDNSADFFVNFNPLDGNGVILGYRFSGKNLRKTLMWFCEEAAKSGMRYIEMLVSAFLPERQRLALDAKFLPCAYFPGMRMNDEGLREDYLIFSRSFEKLDFMDMNLVDNNRRFLDAFMKCWYDLLVRCQPDFDEEWRLG